MDEVSRHDAVQQKGGGSMSTALMRRDDATQSVQHTARSEELKAQALELAAAIGRVSNETEQAEAVAAQQALKSVLKQCEDARKACKEPVLDFGRKIDAVAKAFALDLDSELMRIAKLVGDFQTLEQAKARAAEALRVKELKEIERRRQEELAKAESHEHLTQIQGRFDEEAKALPVVQPAKAKGQVVGKDYEIVVTDIWLLARAHPGCVKIEARNAEIKALLKAGVNVAGVSAKEVTTSTVRAGRLEVVEA